MRVKTILIDDETNARELIRGLLNEYVPNAQIVGEAASVKTAVELIRSLKPDLVFLDLNLLGDNGLEVLDHFEKIDFQVIITTAFDQYALESYKYEVVDYLMKPMTPGNIKRAFERAEKRIARPEDEAAPALPLRAEIRIHTQEDGLRFLAVDRIVRLEANRNYTWIHVSKEGTILVSKTLAKLEKELAPFSFLRTHHSHLVNPSFIHAYDRSNATVSLAEFSEVPVSRERRKLVAEFMARR